MKKIASVICIAAFLVTLSAGAMVAEDITVTLDGNVLNFDMAPMEENGRVLVPMRKIFESLGFNVSWDNEKREALAVRDGDIIKLGENKKSISVNGTEKELDVTAKIAGDRLMVPVRAVAEGAGCSVEWINESRTVEINRIKKVTVSNVTDFLKAISSNTEITLAEGKYNLTTAEAVFNENVIRAKVFDGDEHIFIRVKNLTIKGSGNVLIVVRPRYANVLSFGNCEGIKIENITAGHTVEDGYCIGGVFDFKDSDDITVNNCHMYGCGTYGITAEGSSNIKVNNSEIYECTYGGTWLRNCLEVSFAKTVFRDCEDYDTILMSGCSNVTFEGCEIKNNLSVWNLISAEGCENILFNECMFNDNRFNEKFVYSDNESIELKNCAGSDITENNYGENNDSAV